MDASLGKPALTFLVGYADNRSNKMFETNGDDNQQKLQAAAKLICEAEG
ncbi:MAG: hypothetical protein PVF74_11650 [Anaerolineales bacterium]|jgi:hypothetical protein